MRPPVLTLGEPAGIGPDIALAAASKGIPFVAFADLEMLGERAKILGIDITLRPIDEDALPCSDDITPKELPVVPIPIARLPKLGIPDAANSPYVLECIDKAVRACHRGHAGALVTAPVHKGIINDAGIAFSGHTEWIARLDGVARPVMMLCNDRLRVALATTHLPLRAVPDAIDEAMLVEILRVLEGDLRKRFGIEAPRILVCGLNPHAGEGGHLGREDIESIQPAIDRMVMEGLSVEGPIPADTAFTPARLVGADAVLAMFHDQGLPVLKHGGFGETVNITLGLGFVRTSVDHGTAFDLAGSGKADPSSLIRALEMARRMAPH
ncbi:4-hydroxythreonine-4-phosphate dehydrogenase PdxA [Thioalkalivibrio sp. HK1]|uniref:4-hydroxythreonine-4-phosphate dehydrogenase PdxA n=1 Tax=Thioalkalivibrio sp. HK1 TaxID=1469245 RepID=UPI0004AF3853|nr:4-hydroxythreonine-4-phosphate dehydrogenase PdxA [Thioalkalivibrio sp. HK1]